MSSHQSAAVEVAPLGDRVVLRPEAAAERIHRGLQLPSTVRDEIQRGQVLAVGPGRYEKGRRVPMELSAGHFVLYDKYGGIVVTLKDGELVIIEESEILAIWGVTDVRKQVRCTNMTYVRRRRDELRREPRQPHAWVGL